MSTSPLLPVAGTDGRIEVGDTKANLNKFVVTQTAADLPTTNFESTQGGICYAEGIMGIQECTVMMEGDYDLGMPPWSLFVVGDFVEDVSLYVSKSSNVSFDFDSLRCLSAPTTNSVDGKVTISVTCKSNGTFDIPT